VHRHMERFAQSGLPDASELAKLSDIIKRQLRQQGLPENDLKDSAESVLAALQNVASDERGQWLYDSSHSEARAEWALTAGTQRGRFRGVFEL